MKTIKTIIKELRGAVRRLMGAATIAAAAVCLTAGLPAHAQQDQNQNVTILTQTFPFTNVTILNLNTNAIGGGWIRVPQGQDFYINLNSWLTNATGAGGSGSNLTVSVDVSTDNAGKLATNLLSGNTIYNVTSNYITWSGTVQSYTNSQLFLVNRTNVTGIRSWRIGKVGTTANTNVYYSLAQGFLQ